MEAEGWHDVLFPALRAGEADRGAMDSVRDLIGQLEGQGIHPHPSTIFFPLITAKLSEANKSALKGLFLRQGFVQQIETLEARAKELGTQLSQRQPPCPPRAGACSKRLNLSWFSGWPTTHGQARCNPRLRPS